MTPADHTGDTSTGAKLLTAARDVIPGGVNSATRLVGAPYVLTEAMRRIRDRRRRPPLPRLPRRVRRDPARAQRPGGGRRRTACGRRHRPRRLGRDRAGDRTGPAGGGDDPVRRADDLRDERQRGGRAGRTAGPRRHRPAADPEVPGRLPRLAGRGRAQRHLHARAGVRARPALARHPRRRDRVDRHRRVQRPGLRTRAVRAVPRAHRGGDPGTHPAQRGRPRAGDGVPPGAADDHGRAGVAAHLRRGHHRVPARAGRLPADLRHPSRPDHVRQGDGQRLPDRRAGRAARPHGAVQLRGRRRAAEAGTFNGNAVSSAAGIATITYLRDHPDFYERTHALGDRMRTGLGAIVSELGIPAVAVASAASSPSTSPRARSAATATCSATTTRRTWPSTVA